MPPVTATTYSKVVAAKQHFDFAGISDTATDYTTFSISTGKSGTFSDRTGSAHSIFDVKSLGTVTLANGLYGGIFADLISEHGVGNVAISQAGGAFEPGISNNISILAKDGSVGNFTGTVTGIGGSGSWDVAASGAIGNILINNAGTRAQDALTVHADSNIGNITVVNAGLNSSGSAWLYTDHGNVGNILFNETGKGASQILNATVSGNVGNVTNNATGQWSSGGVFINAVGSGFASGSVGNVVMTATGLRSLDAFRIDSAENIGNVSLSATGAHSVAGSWWIGNQLDASGSIGNITGTATGFSSYVGVIASAYTGNIGNVNLTAAGVNAYASGNFSVYEGSVGNITLSATGANSSATASAFVGTNMGNIILSATGRNSDVTFSGSANANMANITINMTGSGAYASGIFEASGSIGNIAIAATGAHSSAYTDVSAGLSIGNISITANGVSAYAYTSIRSYDTNIGNITVTAGGAQSVINLTADASGNIGNVNVVATGLDSYVSAYIGASGNLGDVTMKAVGNGSFASGSVFAGSGSAGNITVLAQGVFASAFVSGEYNTDYKADYGNITISATGNYAVAYGSLGDSGSGNFAHDLGNISVNATGLNAFALFITEDTGNANNIKINAANSASAYFSGFMDGIGQQGNITVTSTTSGYASGYLDTSGAVGNIALTSVRGQSKFYLASKNTSGSAGVGNITLNTNSAYVSGYIHTSENIGNISITNVNGSANLQARAGWDHILVGSVGNIAIATTATAGENAYTSAYISAGHGGIGSTNITTTGVATYAAGHAHTNIGYNVSGGGNLNDITLTNAGYSAENYVSARVLGHGSGATTGDIGNITIIDKGVSGYTQVSANAYSGNIGNLNVTMTGINSEANVRLIASGVDSGFGGSGILDGNIGNITLNVSGNYNGASAAVSADGGDDGTTGDGNIGNIAINVSGSYNSGYVNAYTSGGTISDATVRVINTINDQARLHFTGYNANGDSGYIGDVSMKLINATGGYSGGLNFSGNLVGSDAGNVSLTSSGLVKGEANYMDVQFSAFARDGFDSTIGNITINNQSNDGYTYTDINANEVGNVDVTVGNGASTFSGMFRATPDYLGSSSGNHTLAVSNISVHAGLDNVRPSGALMDISIQFSGNGFGMTTLDIGNITIDGGSSESHATIDFWSYGEDATFGGSITKVDLSHFNGSAYIDMSSLSSGMNILGAVAGNTIYGTRGDDNITGGAGHSYIAGGLGIDALTGGAAADTFAYSEGDSYISGAAIHFDTITNFGISSVDSIEFDLGNLEILSSATGAAGTASTGIARIDANGVATFASADDTLAERVIAVEAALAAHDVDGTAGYVSVFDYAGNSYAFIGDGVDGVSSSDLLVELVGINVRTDSQANQVVISEDLHSFSLA